MKTTQAWGCLAAGVLAAGLNAAYHDGGLQWVHRVTDRVEQNSTGVLALASGQAERFLAEARLLTAHPEAASVSVRSVFSEVKARVGDETLSNVEARVARCQAQSARVEAMSAREEARLARIEAIRAKIEARLAARVLVPVAVTVPVCPRVHIPRLPRINVPAPVVRSEMPGSGPV